MTDPLSIGLTKLLRKATLDGDIDFLREGVRVVSQALMELEVTQHVGAKRHARQSGLASAMAIATDAGAIVLRGAVSGYVDVEDGESR
jgi:hypothetical protein